MSLFTRLRSPRQLAHFLTAIWLIDRVIVKTSSSVIEIPGAHVRGSSSDCPCTVAALSTTRDGPDEESDLPQSHYKRSAPVKEQTHHQSDTSSSRSCDQDDKWRPISTNWDSRTDVFLLNHVQDLSSDGLTSTLIRDYTRGVDDFNCGPELVTTLYSH